MFKMEILVKGWMRKEVQGKGKSLKKVLSSEFVSPALAEFHPKVPRKHKHTIMQPLLVFSKAGRIEVWR